MVFTELEPKIYRVLVGSTKKTFNLQEIRDRYSVRDKLYGNVHKILYRIPRLVELGLLENLSVVAEGKKGMGKTTSMNMMANTILDLGVPVIEIKYMNVSVELIEFLSGFRNVCIYIDELGKYFNMEYQGKLLTLLNKDSMGYKIFLMGDNEKRNISTYIWDRMERVRYHLSVNRVENKDLIEYCKDNEVGPAIVDRLLEINTSSSQISYDTLEVLAEEHHIFPELDFDELVGPMNCAGVIGVSVLELLDVTIMDSDELAVSSFSQYDTSNIITSTDFMAGTGKMYIQIQIAKLKKDEEETTEESPAQPYTTPMFGVKSKDMTDYLNLSAAEIKDIDDSDGRMTLEMSTCGTEVHKYKIVIGSKIVSRESVPERGGRGRFFG